MGIEYAGIRIYNSLIDKFPRLSQSSLTVLEQITEKGRVLLN